MFITKTRCMKGWPWIYQTYHQQTAYPYKHAARAYVMRLGRVGLVVGRWSRRMPDEDSAQAAALGARPTPLLDGAGLLLPQYRPDHDEVFSEQHA